MLAPCPPAQVNMAGCPTFSLKALPASRALYAAQGTTPSPKPTSLIPQVPFSISLPTL